MDHETKSVYNIRVTALDNENDPSNQKSTISDVIIVNVLDVNDNAPYITNIDPTPLSVKEGTNTGERVKILTAFDPDSGDNGKVIFSLTNDQNTTGNTHQLNIL